jgi:hypothetical protein
MPADMRYSRLSELPAKMTSTRLIWTERLSVVTKVTCRRESNVPLCHTSPAGQPMGDSIVAKRTG